MFFSGISGVLRSCDVHVRILGINTCMNVVFLLGLVMFLNLVMCV